MFLAAKHTLIMLHRYMFDVTLGHPQWLELVISSKSTSPIVI